MVAWIFLQRYAINRISGGHSSRINAVQYQNAEMLVANEKGQ